MIRFIPRVGNPGVSSGDFLPPAADTFDLGSTTFEWDNVYLGNDGGVLIGLDQDIVLHHRSTTLGANTVLAGVIVGTPVTPAVAADSVIFSNITASGDFLFTYNQGGHSIAFLHMDASTGDLALFADTGSSFDVYIGATKEIDYSTGAMAFQQGTVISAITGNLTIYSAAGADVLIGDGATFIFVDGGTNSIGLGAVAAGNSFLLVNPTYTSQGSSNHSEKINLGGVLIGFSGDTSRLVGVEIGGSITTQSVAETVTDIAGLMINEPIITKNVTTITNATTLKIVSAPTEGSNNYALWVASGRNRFDGRVLESQGADIGSTNNLVLGDDGNIFEITGTTDINLISNLTWQNGATIRLLFTSTATVKDAQATSTTNITILLDGSADFVPSAGDTLQLTLCEIGGTQAWRETGSRNVL